MDDLSNQDTGGCFTFSVVVVDNDRSESAKRVVEGFILTSPIQVTYCVEPRQNIALARNKAIENAKGDFIAFIDDDELPTEGWLRNLLASCNAHGAAGALGPVKPYFSDPPPDWIVKGKIVERPTYATGHVMDWRESRTGNLLFKKEVVSGLVQPFRSQFGTGGEDVDFFERMMKNGYKFVWCNEAEVYEEVSHDRLKRSYYIRRGLLRGKNTFQREGCNPLSIAKSIIALTAYGLTLPFILIGGQHLFMRYAIKCSDHAGKVLAAINLNPVSER